MEVLVMKQMEGLMAIACWSLSKQRRQRVTEAIEIHAPDEMLNVNRPAVR
jgi:hypothetical protein